MKGKIGIKKKKKKKNSSCQTGSIDVKDKKTFTKEKVKETKKILKFSGR